jgi:Tol biopolymer transport system component
VLNAGTKLGPYEIVAPLGAGGMGEVYKARDTRLDRTVALKILSDALAADPQFRERFEREAKTISQLSHAHICTLFDVGDGFLVMEFLEGETLAERLVKVSTLKSQASGLPVDQALTIAIQMAEALECAHRAGVVHRDLKPGNIFLTAAGAKLLDFGLAKQGPGSSGMAGQSNLSAPPTMTTPLTGQGTIVGTFQYMSPEQLEGKDVDARADTFAFGAVLFEMLAGRRAFQGRTQFTVMGAILEHDPPPISSVAPSVPSALDRIMQKCLAKDPARRWQSMADLADELRWIAEQRPAAPVAGTSTGAAAATATAPAAPARATRRRITGVVKGVAIAAASVLATWTVIRSLPSARQQPVHFVIVPPSAQPLGLQGADRDVAISPDGTRIVYRAGTGQQQLMVRAIDQLDARPLAGITGFRAPFISPDSHWVGFFDEAELKKVSITGGPPISLARFAGAPRGASWGPDDTIVFSTADASTGLLQVPAVGGEPKVLTRPDVGRGESDHFYPSFLPGGRAVLFTITTSGQAENSEIAVLDLKSGQRKTLIRGGTNGEFVSPSTSAGSGQPGYLVYAAAGTLRAVRFDPARLEVLSDPVPVVEQVMTSGTGAANFAISRSGTLLYVPGAGTAGARRTLVWVDRQGREEPVTLPPRAYIVARLSPDGTRIALDIRDQENDIWVWDLGRRTLTRLTFDPAPDQYPVWTPDGRRIIFNSARAGVANLYRQVADGTGTVERLTTSPNSQVANAVSPDGTRVVLTETSPKTGIDLLVMPLDGPRRPEPLIATQFPEANADISPDGRWIAYQSSESGQNQVYVRPFPQVEAGRWQLSSGGGSRPMWAKSGRELFYLEGNNALMTVPVQTTGTTFSAGNPTRLFEGRYFAGPAGRLYDVTRDGQRFLMIKDNLGGDPTPLSMVVVLNWVEELKARVPSR